MKTIASILCAVLVGFAPAAMAENDKCKACCGEECAKCCGDDCAKCCGESCTKKCKKD